MANLTQVLDCGKQGWFLRLLTLVVLMAVGPDAWGQKTGPRPGEDDPLGKPSRYNLFPDHELLAVLAHDPATGGLNSEFSFNSFAPSADLKTLTPLGGATNLAMDLNAPQMGAAAGRILASDRDQIVYARRTGSSLAVAFLGYSNSTTTLSPLANQLPDSADVFDIAVGDLDKVADLDGNNHDEVVVCFATTPNYAVRVAVLDYTVSAPAPADAVRPQITTTAQASRRIDLNDVQPIDAVLACAIGDFDGDGQNEIAVVGLDGGRTLWINTFRYTIEETGQRTLQQASTVTAASPPSPRTFAGNVDAVVGDFNGDGRDDLAVSYVIREPDSFTGNCRSAQISCSSYSASVVVVGSDQNLNLTFGGHYDLGSTEILDIDAKRLDLPGAQVVSGLFKFDPSNGFGFNRRQLALAAHFFSYTGPEELKIAALVVSNDLRSVTAIGAALSFPYDINITPHISLAAGGFSGNGDIQNPQWSLAVSAWMVPSTYDLRILKVGSGGLSVTFEKRYAQPVLNDFRRFPLIAYDADGDSIYLGAPVHFTISDLIRPQIIFQEPPKHTAYLSGQVANVSRLSTFYVELKDSKGTTFASTKNDTTDWNIGGSLAQTATVTAQEGVEAEMVNVGAKQTFDFALTVGYDYEGHEESYNSQYATQTLTFTDQTIADDLLVAELQTFDIWRYRAFGISLPNGQNPPLNGFYEIVLPGPKTVVRGGGASFDWYQPVHENGNILSYPALRNNTFTPPDLGSFTLPDKTKKTEPLLPATLLAFDGISGTVELVFSQSSGAGSVRSAAHTLAENVDTSLAAEATAIVAGSGGSTSISTQLNFHNSNSLSNVTTSESETNTSTGITLVKAAGTANRAYNFAPVFYFAKDGTVKVVHAVDVLGNAAGRSFWASTYGQKPDPALNLPLRFERDLTPFSETWLANTLSSRKKIRGFFLRKAGLNTVTNDYDYLAKAPVEGDEVRIETRVYNYSTAQAANNVTVRFQVIGYNDASDTEVSFTSCPAGTLLNNGRCTIGETFVSLDPLAMRPVAITWDTSGFGPTVLGGAKEYRVYVVLDPDNTINEIYETDSVGGATCSDPTNPGSTITCNPGQNNEGYGVITIAHAPLPQGSNKPPHADVHLRKGAVAAIDAKRGTLFTDAVDAYLNRPLRIRVHVTADVSDRQHYHLLVYKGDPQQGAEVIAGKLLQGIDAEDGDYVWFEWTPPQLGNFTLHAQLLEQEDDVIPGNGKGVLKVRVKPVPKGK